MAGSRLCHVAELALKPMSSAPKDTGAPFEKVLALDLVNDAGTTAHVWRLVYWLDAFDGRPAGWYGENCGDLRNPQGWVLSTSELPRA